MRIQELLSCRVIRAAGDVPADAIPASLEVVRRWRASSSTFHRAPFYRDLPFQCEDCGRDSVWSAQDQRHWFEVLHGSPYSEARRCAGCRRKRKGIAPPNGSLEDPNVPGPQGRTPPTAPH